MIESSVTKASIFAELERIRRTSYLEEHEWSLSSKMESIRRKYTRDEENLDPCLLALDAIVENSSKRAGKHIPKTSGRRAAKHSQLRVSMPFVHVPPKYDGWIPVKTNYWVGKELNMEPYMPFLGDQDQDCERAFEVFQDMAGSVEKEIDLSDGEVTRDGKFRMPKDDIDRVDYYSLAQMRWREGSRKAILAVMDQFVKFDDTMWRILATALGIQDMRRVKAIAKVAQQRRGEHEARVQRRQRQERKLQEHEHAWRRPWECEVPEDEERNANTGFMKHFCLICHMFACPQHDSFNLEPIIPIPDARTTERERLLKEKLAEPCGDDCFLHDWDDSDEENEKWTREEILCMRESVPIFGLDPCSIAVIVGSKTCREVDLKLKDRDEADTVKYELAKSRRPKRLDGNKRPGDATQKAKQKLNSKTVVDYADMSAMDQDFEPCYHNGPCTPETCSCVKKGMHCEATCGCKSGRFGEGGPTGGIVWHPSPPERKGAPCRSCQNRHYGCGCVDGHCNDSKCICWEYNVACTPDFCDCDCVTLPHHISIKKRRCRNTPANIAMHKRTCVGKSDVHGLGLFAGEKFEKGDLVGVYSGQLIDTRLADVIGRLYDATNRTYIFNVTESLVIDGGLLGSKVKFINHTTKGDGDNCVSRLVRVRGDAYVALFCVREVNIGEEFLFDYRFTGEVPQWALEDKPRGKK